MKEARKREGRKGECLGCPQAIGGGKRDGGVKNPLPAATVILRPGGLCAQALQCVHGPGGVTPRLPVGFGFRATEALWARRGLRPCCRRSDRRVCV